MTKELSRRNAYLNDRHEYFLKSGILLSLEEVRYFQPLYEVLEGPLRDFFDKSKANIQRIEKVQLEAITELEKAKCEADSYAKQLESAKKEIEVVNEKLEESLNETKKLKEDSDVKREEAERKLDIELRKKRFKLVNIIIYSFLALLGTVLTFTFVLVLNVPRNEVVLSTFSQVVIATLTGALSALGTFVGVKQMIKDTPDNDQVNN